MRVKYATYKEIDGKYLCSECLTKYSFKNDAIKCVTEHNTSTNKLIEKTKKEFEDYIKGFK